MNAALAIGAGSTGAASFIVQGSNTLSGTIAAGQSVWLQGNSGSGFATLTASGAVTNHGTILLQSVGSSYTDKLDAGSFAFTNAADGTIQTVAGSGGSRLLFGNILNLGTVSVGASTALAVNSGVAATTVFTNQGQVTVDPAGLATFGGTYAAAGGTITGPGYVFNGTLSITASPASPITTLVAGSSSLATNVLPNNVVWVQGNNTLGLNTFATLSPASTGLVNHGTILLQSINGSGYTDKLDAGSFTFSNAADGTIQAMAGTGGSRLLFGNILNLGAVTVGASTALAVNSGVAATTVFTNQGQVTVDPAGLATFGGTYAAAGGTITGPGYVFNGTLSITASPASPITILVAGNTALATNVLPNNVVWVQGNNTLGLNTSATLSPATGLVNHGTILLQSINGSGYTDTLACGSGFTNGTDGTIQVVAGSGGSRVITGSLTNLGTVSVGASTALAVNSGGAASAIFTN